MSDQLWLKSFRLQNFKAVRDSGQIRFTPLTVFIGNNGSGKSSIIEGLQTYQSIVARGLNKAMTTWRGFEHIVNPPVSFSGMTNGARRKIRPIEFTLDGTTVSGSFRTSMTLNMSENGDRIFVEREALNLHGRRVLLRDQAGQVFSAKQERLRADVPADLSILSPPFIVSTYDIAADREQRPSNERFDVLSMVANLVTWQFVTLNPQAMGQPKPQNRSGEPVRLETDGSNIAEYLLDIGRQDPRAFEGIIDTLQYVLPYARDLQPSLASELERTVYLRMTEADFKVPGWLLSTGTLRILALLALLRHPSPPRVIFIEEIENGLDPRTIHLLVEELRSVIERGMTQVIITTHSPYLLDLLALSQIVLVERVDGQPTFFRPADHQALEAWSQNFGPGRLYTMSKLSRGVG